MKLHHHVARSIVSVLAPPLCPLCGGLTIGNGLCSSCWQGLRLASNLACRRCAIPFAHGGASSICAQCLTEPPHFDGVVAAMIYNDTARKLILALKHGDRFDIAPILARIMLRGSIGFLSPADAVIPLPLHSRRFFKRRFNQSAEIARYLISEAGLARDKMKPQLLYRRFNTPSQGGMTKEQRKRNLRGAFAVTPHAKSWLKGKNIVLVDDVLTTGASLSAAARCLKRGGAKTVNACVAARVP